MENDIDQFDIIVGKNNKLTFVECGEFYIVGTFNDWENDYYVKKIVLEIKKEDEDPNNYYLFHSNYCSLYNKFEIHIALTGFTNVLKDVHVVKNIGKDFCLKPKSDGDQIHCKVDVEVFLYDITLRCKDKYMYICGSRTLDIVKPYMDETCNEAALFRAKVNPIPERKGKSILVGKT